MGPSVEERAIQLEERIKEMEEKLKDNSSRRPIVSPVPTGPQKKKYENTM